MGNKHMNRAIKTKDENVFNSPGDIKNLSKISFGNSDTQSGGGASTSPDKYLITDPIDHSNIKQKKSEKIKESLLLNNKNNKFYKIIKIIGTGFHSKVYLAEIIKDKTKKKKYAIKSIKKESIIKNNLIELILNEKKILQKLKNSFVVELIETFQNDKKLFFVFPYYQYDLFNVLRFAKKSLLNENLFKIILAQLYVAISFLHENNIIYRDLKPENIVVDDEKGKIVLIDFGLSEMDVTSNSSLSHLCGTNEYIPPEVIKRAGYNFNFDWWGYGIFMYELFYGKPPFRANTQKEIFDKIINNEIYYDPDVSISNEAKDLISYLLAKDLDYRIKPEQIPYHPFFKGINFDNLNAESVFRKIINNSNLKKKVLPIVKEFKLKLKGEKNIIIDQGTFVDF